MGARNGRVGRCGQRPVGRPARPFGGRKHRCRSEVRRMRRLLTALAVLCALAAGSFSAVSQAADGPSKALDLMSTPAQLAPPRAPGTADRYAPAGGCFALRSVQSGKLVTRAGEAFAANGAKGEAFRFQAMDLGKYLLFASK